MFAENTGLVVTVTPSIVFSELWEITGAIGLLVGSFSSGVIVSLVSELVDRVIGEQHMSPGTAAYALRGSSKLASCPPAGV